MTEKERSSSSPFSVTATEGSTARTGARASNPIRAVQTSADLRAFLGRHAWVEFQRDHPDTAWRIMRHLSFKVAVLSWGK